MQDSLKPVALVTGGAVRVGRIISLYLARRGYQICVHYHRSESAAGEVVDSIRKAGGQASSFCADLTKLDQLTALVNELLGSSSRVELLVNNASSFPRVTEHNRDRGLLVESERDWELALALNVRAPFFLIQKLAPCLSQSSRGRIINILDSSVSRPYLSRASHTVSKHALRGLTKVAANTLAGQVKVYDLELGTVLLEPEDILKWKKISAKGERAMTSSELESEIEKIISEA